MRKFVLLVVLILIGLAVFVFVTPLLPEGSGIRDFSQTMSDGLAAFWGQPIRP